MAAGGHGLAASRRQAPAAAVNAATGSRGRDLKGGFVNRLAGDKAGLVQIQPVAQIQRPAGRLRAGRPGCVIVRRGLRNVWIGAAGGRADDRHSLPVHTGGRRINVGIVVAVRLVGGHAAGKLGCRLQEALGCNAVRVVLHDPQLFVVVVGVGSLIYLGGFAIQAKG